MSKESKKLNKYKLQNGVVKYFCKCKKTKCVKKYCECYNAGYKCGE